MTGSGRSCTDIIPCPILVSHKSFYLSCKRKIDKTILGPALVDTLIQDFALCSPLYHYLRETILRTKQKT